VAGRWNRKQPNWRRLALLPWLALLLMAWSVASGAAGYTIETVAGSGFIGDGGPAVAALFGQLEGVALDAKGNFYVADAVDHRVRKITPDGLIQTVAGTGVAGFSGDGGPANQAQLNAPYGLAVDTAGNLYIADLGNARVRKVTAASGTIQTVAGGGTIPAGGNGDGGAATSAKLTTPRNVALDGAGDLYISDFDGQRVYQVSISGTLTTLAGNGTSGYAGDNGAAVLAQISYPAGLAADAQGGVYIADSNNHRVRRVYHGQIATIGISGATGTTVLLPRTPTGMYLDGAGNLWVADAGGGQVYKLNAFGAVSVLPVAAQDVTADAAGNLYAASGGTLKKITPAGGASVVAGTGAYRFSGDGGAASSARLNAPLGVAVDAVGNLYIADTGNHRIRKVSLGGIITTIVGTGQQGYSGDGGVATAAQINSPNSVAVDAAGNIYIADTGNHRVREVTAGGVIQTLAGTGTAGFSGDGALGSGAQLSSPSYVAVDGTGSVYIADTGNQRVRKVASGGVISTIAGDGMQSFGGDGGAAVAASFNTPRGLALDSAGNLYVADAGNRRVRVVSPKGLITTLGTGSGVFGSPRGMVVSAAGDVYVADTGTNQIVHLDASGNWSVLAGNGTAAFGGDGGAAPAAELNAPEDVALDGLGNLYIADALNNRIRELTLGAPAAASLDAGQPQPGLTVVNAASLLSGAIAPGEILSIFGAGLGSQTAAGSQMAAPQVLANAIGGTQVLFNGGAAALFYAQNGQVNVQAPYELAGAATANIQVIYNGVIAGQTTVAVTDTAPAIFTMGQGTGQVAALNQDGTLNSTANPALRGSVVTLFATGEGQTTPSGVDGGVSASPYPAPLGTVSLRVGGYPAEILFAQEAPGLVGVLQINAQLPGGYAAGGVLPVVLQVGNAVSPAGVTIAVE